MNKIKLCELSVLNENDTRGFDFESPTGPFRLFVIFREGLLYAYRNKCPHTGAPLEWMPDRFLDYDNMFIQCALHGALFAVDSGLCLRGPCAGDVLESLELSVENGCVYLVGSAADSLSETNRH